VLRLSRWPRALRVGVPAVVLPAVVTVLTALPFSVSTTTASLAFVLAVTGAAVVGGFASGFAASLVSFLALNFFFTPPRFTFTVGKTEDVVALAVFLLVSAVVGSLLSRAISQRIRAERREREALLLQYLGTRLLSGEPLEHILGSFGQALTELVGVIRFEVIMLPEERLAAEVGPPADPGLRREEFPILAGTDSIGSIRTYTDADATGPEQDRRRLVRAFTAQLGLALESARMARVAGEAQVSAERSQLQAALLQSVTHDLRTPLASITASVTSLLDTSTELGRDDRRELLETIRHEAERLDRLVGNLLDLSRLRAGALTPSKRRAAIEEVVEGVLARMEPSLGRHRLNVIVREGLPEVPLDVVQIDQALTNILENAAKYSPPGSQITVSAARWDNAVEVRIADQGSGIPKDVRDRVFEPFFRAPGGAAEGTGLGLAIAHAVVTAHRGTIWIEDAPGGGSAVTLRLPLNEPS
jgi:two-component system sensor histidine kinase KdpD